MIDMTPGDVRRFVAKIDRAQEPPCWIWTGAPSGPGANHGDGYGLFSLRGRRLWAHRMSYELYVGPIPDGMQIDHLCRVRMCVNPAHPEAVTQRENLRRGSASRTHCRRGHALDGGGTCSTCERQRSERASARKRARRQTATHCRNGHAYAETEAWSKSGARYCRACWRRPKVAA